MLKVFTDINQSSLVVSREFRLYNSINRRINGLQFQFDVLRSLGSLKDFDQSDYQGCLTILRGLSRRLDTHSIICNGDVYKVVLQVFNLMPKTLRSHSIALFGSYVPRSNKTQKRLDYINEEISKGFFNKDHKLMLFDDKRKCELELSFLKNLKFRCLKARKCELEARLRLEVLEAVRNGWYVVFNTLTVSPDNFKEVFDVSSTSWTDYVRSVDRAIGISVYGSWSLAKKARDNKEEFHRYFAVTEKGSKSGRLHFHVLHFMKELPKGCFDPNRGSKLPKNREIFYLKRFWKFGHSTPIAVRFDGSDSYAKLNWVWPYVLSSSGVFLPLQCKAPEAIIKYVGKYITKSHEDTENHKEVFQWRTKMSQSLGKRFLNLVIKKCNQNQLEMLVRIRSARLLQTERGPMPLSLMKRLAMQELIVQFKKKAPRMLWSSMVQCPQREGILTHVRRMIQGTLPLSSSNFGSIRLLDLLVMEGFNLRSMILELENSIFGEKKISYNICGRISFL